MADAFSPCTGNQLGSGLRETWVQILALPAHSYVTLDTVPNAIYNPVFIFSSLGMAEGLEFCSLVFSNYQYCHHFPHPVGSVISLFHWSCQYVMLIFIEYEQWEVEREEMSWDIHR